MIIIINNFFKNVKNFDDGIKLLIENKDYIYNKYTKIQSKKILYSMMIYKFGKELECPNLLQEKARNIILYSLDNVKYTENMLKKEIYIYLQEFDKWKNTDLDKVLFELCGSYINLEEIKKNIILKSKDNKTHVDDEWLENLNNLMEKIEKYGHKLNKIKFNTVLQNLKMDINNEKEKLVSNIIKKIYWENFQNDIKNNNYDILYKNFEEIKTILLEIKPDIDTQEILDIDYLKKLLENNLFEPINLINYITFINDKLILYGIPIYDNIVKDTKNKLINDIKEKGLTPETITNSFKNLMELLENLIIIIRIYRKQLDI